MCHGATAIRIDTSPPTGSLVINNGAAKCTATTVLLDINASDGTGVWQMRIRNDGGSYTGWLDYSPGVSWGLNATPGVRTVGVQFRDWLGQVSAEFTDSITYLPATTLGSIGEMKKQTLSSACAVEGKVVTGLLTGAAYIEEPERGSGIRVNLETLAPALVEGSCGRFAGILGKNSDSEPELYLTEFVPSAGQPVPDPLVMNTRWIGGGEWGSFGAPSGGVGLHSIGLLVQVAGTVMWRSPDLSELYLDEGGGGVLVDVTLYGAAPAPGARLLITGLLGTKIDHSVVVPLLRVRKPVDVQMP